MSDEAEVFGAMLSAAFHVGIAEVWHRLKWCDGYRGCPISFRRIDQGVTCVPCREEIERYKAGKLFSEWDALGLGYIGPRLQGRG